MSPTAQPLSLFVWYTISSGAGEEPLPITREELKDLLVKADIDPQFLPDTSRAIDAFRSATTAATDEYDSDGTPMRLVVRETRQTPTHVMRQVFRQWTNAESGEIEEQRVADLQFFRPRRTAAGRVHGTERLRILVDQRMSGLDRARVDALVKRIQAAYKTNRDRLSSHAVRAVARTYLYRLGAVAVADSGGGAYLLPPEHRAEAQALQAVIRQCGPGCRLRVIPLPDEPDLREMVVESIDVDIETRALVLVRDVGEWVAGHPEVAPTTARWTGWRAECRIMQDLLLDYSDRYDATFPRAGAALDTLMEMTDELGLLVAAARKAR